MKIRKQKNIGKEGRKKERGREVGGMAKKLI